MSALVRSRPVHAFEIRELRLRIDSAESTLHERLAALEVVEAELTAFEARYRRDVGRLHEQLDELNFGIAEAELRELAEDVGGHATRPAPDGTDDGAPVPERPPRLTSDAIRKLFRDVAKAIHPDLADEEARHERHALMVEANRAYAQGDEWRLREILRRWERSTALDQGADGDTLRLHLLRRLAQLHDHVDACTTELAGQHDSPLWQLKTMVDEAAAQGKDLVGDMVRRLKRDILAAQNRLDAMRSYR